MSEFAQEMQGLEAEMGVQDEHEQTAPSEGGRNFNPEDQKNVVKEAMRELEEDHRLKQQQIKNQEERQQLAKKQQMEQQEYQERAQEALGYLEQFYNESPGFKKVMDEVEISPQLVAEVADVCDDGEIPAVMAELAVNDDQQEKLLRAKTAAGVKRVIRQTRNLVLSGYSPESVHPMYGADQPGNDVNIGDESEDAYYQKMSESFNTYR